MEQGMNEFSPTSCIEALCALLNNSAAEEEEEENNQGLTSSALVGPGDIGPLKKQEQEFSTSTHKEIWNALEVPEGSEFDDSLDPREQPEYEILFKQQVGSEDIFLGMSRKDPSTACCEYMVVRIQLPNTKSTDVSLDIRKKFLDLRTPKFKLGLHLPHPVNEKNGKAKFMVDREILEVTLAMVRDLDFINLS
ncbi:dynein axonemal assembly factor 6 [Pseudophryne corroboree]|uniref:dynein axonemal assembly factor 6 n=1 Tax=Pseudophryne corroboree TaxID=495146 RepID=UPI003081E42E